MAFFGFGKKKKINASVSPQDHKYPPVKYYDLHCHILPGMDDGAKDEEASLAILQSMIEQGCDGLVATSHYYNRESINQFLERREAAYNKLMDALHDSDISFFANHIMLGAEAAYHSNLVNDPDLEKLCFMNPITGSNTKYLLLEMPFSPWSKNVLRDVSNLIHVRNVTPIIAHLERFYEFTSKESIEELLSMPVIIQSNAGALTHLSNRRRALKMAENGTTQVLGTDAHNMERRHPNMAHGIAVLEREGLGQDAKEILAMNEKIYWKVSGN